MIRIYKSTTAPVILSEDGVIQTEILAGAYKDDSPKYTSAPNVKNRSITRMLIDSKIYGHIDVKTLLKSDQHQKCCFCESSFLETSNGDVEHFRPKIAYKKSGSRSYVYPGYYWLVYDWSNLMFSCEKCNRTYKKNEFPLGNETSRKLYHDHLNLIVNEDRLLIDPTVEDPAIFMTFKNEVPIPVNNSLKGLKTIKILDLERFNDTRQNYIHLLGGLLAFREIDTEDKIISAMSLFKFTRQQVIDKIAQSDLLYNSAAKDSAKFAHCVRINFPHLPKI